MHKTLFSTLALLTATLLLFSCGKHSFDDVFDDPFGSSSSSVEGSSSSNLEENRTIESINEILLNFYEKHQIKGGVSMTISYNERLVYAGSVGYADYDQNIKLTPEHRMRIASVSKPITSIAIMKLLEEEIISLDDLVFGKNGILNNEYGMPTYNGNHVDITIKQLLEHSSGGWGNVAAGRFNNITKVLEDFHLEYLPNTHHEYSNFGYHVLGRVIERKSGMTYEDYVKENILELSGVNGMRIGANHSEPDEVVYISDDGRNPYTSVIPGNMDASGGWIATPVELLKLLVRVDGFSNVQDILNSETINTMTTRSITNERYALGWRLNQAGNNWYHTGTMAGTSSMIARSSNRFNWVILINYRPPDSIFEEFRRDIDNLFWEIHRTVAEWPAGIEL
ncbi:MAG: beta-lactamase family protein [Fibromonadaceae bacterium]|jgi:CubicO group peptidase (beta-lactamase class C family)|nr:beta-lactamase family protein [Fibromonadaceae bacterium]